MVNTFGAQLLATLAVGMLPRRHASMSSSTSGKLFDFAFTAHALMKGLCSMTMVLCAFVLMHHSKVWDIIAPRLVFEALHLGWAVVGMIVLRGL